MEHDAMLKTLVNSLLANKYTNIKCELPDHTKPQQIVWSKTGERLVPDVTSELAGKQQIFEVETNETISVDRTIRQLKLFSKHAQETNKNFYVVVPRNSMVDFQKVLTQHSIDATILHIG